MTDKKNYFNNNLIVIIKEALLEAKKAGDMGEVPVGAVVFKDKVIISKAGNRMEKNNDASAHAEIIAMKKAGETLSSSRLIGCNIYVTLQPCTMCSFAISLFRIKRLYFGAYNDLFNVSEEKTHFKSSQNKIYRPEVYGGIASYESNKLLKDFFKKIR